MSKLQPIRNRPSRLVGLTGFARNFTSFKDKKKKRVCERKKAGTKFVTLKNFSINSLEQIVIMTKCIDLSQVKIIPLFAAE